MWLLIDILMISLCLSLIYLIAAIFDFLEGLPIYRDDNKRFILWSSFITLYLFILNTFAFLDVSYKWTNDMTLTTILTITVGILGLIFSLAAWIDRRFFYQHHYGNSPIHIKICTRYMYCSLGVFVVAIIFYLVNTRYLFW